MTIDAEDVDAAVAMVTLMPVVVLADKAIVAATNTIKTDQP